MTQGLARRRRELTSARLVVVFGPLGTGTWLADDGHGLDCGEVSAWRS